MEQRVTQNQSDVSVEDFARRFLTGRINWRGIPRLDAITDFGNIISLILYRNGQYQVELFIVPFADSFFTKHKHPDVDVVEFGLTGKVDLFINDQLSHSQGALDNWLLGRQPTIPIHIKPTDWHSGVGYTPYAFLSIQKWLHGVVPTSVGLNWTGEPSSVKQQALWKQQ